MALSVWPGDGGEVVGVPAACARPLMASLMCHPVATSTNLACSRYYTYAALDMMVGNHLYLCHKQCL